MKLKYNLIAWSLLGFFAAACDPMDDIYNEIDAEGTTNTQTMAEYVLTDADYETISSAAAKAATSDAEKALANAVKTDKALTSLHRLRSMFLPSSRRCCLHGKALR